MSSRADDAVTGMALGQSIARAMANRDETEALRLVNEADHVHLRWATMQLASHLWSMTLTASRGNERKASRVLLDGASRVEDSIETYLRLTDEEGGSHG